MAPNIKQRQLIPVLHIADDNTFDMTPTTDYIDDASLHGIMTHAHDMSEATRAKIVAVLRPEQTFTATELAWFRKPAGGVP